MTADVCLQLERTMIPQKDVQGSTAIADQDTLPEATPARPSDDLSIFSAPGLEVVFQWWLESNRRWTERERAKATAA
jgi:hypothetical protein